MKPEATQPTEETLPVMGEAAFEQLYRREWKQVFAICLHYVADEQTAADLAQDVFAMAWRKRALLKPGTPVHHYLYRAAKLQAQGHWRAAGLHRGHVESAHRDNPTAVNSTENDVHYNELQERIDGILTRLPEQAQTIYRLSREKGLDNRSIALATTLSEKAVEYHLYKATATLKKFLSDYQ